MQPDLKEAKLHTWNVAFQRQLPWSLVGEVAYVGNVGRGILLPDYNINSMQVKLDRRFRNGFLLNTSYTLARAINYQDETAGTFTPADIERCKGRAGFDRTHAFAASFIWDMPFLRNDQEHWLNDKKIVEYEWGSIQKAIAASKFKDMPLFMKAPEGHIGIQHHGEEAWFRNIRVRKP